MFYLYIFRTLFLARINKAIIIIIKYILRLSKKIHKSLPALE